MMNTSKTVYLVFTSNSRMYPYLPSSSLALAAKLLSAGYRPVIIDTELEDWRKYDFSDGLCVCVSTFTGPWLKTALTVTQEVKAKLPDMKVFWGGPHVIALPEVTARHPLIDAACYTEGENVLLALAAKAASGDTDYSTVKGIAYRDGLGVVIKTPAPDPVVMDELDLPPYELLNLKLYPIASGRVYYQSSRGCPFTCRFCVYENRTGWRGRSPGKVIDDFERLIALFNPEEIQMFDGNFFAGTARVREIMKEKVRRNMRFRWMAFCRFDTFAHLAEEDLSLLRESGCVELKFGGESGSRKVLDYINKQTRPEQITEGVRRCRKYGILPTLSFMTGFPKETREDLDETLLMIRALRTEFPGIGINGLFLLMHLPNTPLTEEVKRDFGLKQPETLEGWVDYPLTWTRRGDYPWMSRADFSYRKTMSSLLSYLYITDMLVRLSEKQRKGTPLRSEAAFALFKLADTLIRKTFVALRWEKGVTCLPLEWRAWDIVREKALRLL
ncbi:MAG: B12-binding domain-containing radical SAM protein [Endomicrobiales bacterium]